MSSQKVVFSSDTPYERLFGYSRSVRKGPIIYVSGTTALKSGAYEEDSSAASKVDFPNDAGRQATAAMQRCAKAVEELGGRIADVMRVRMFVSRHEDCEAVGAAMRRVFIDSVNPAESGLTATMIVIKDGFVDPDILVEVEVEAYCG